MGAKSTMLGQPYSPEGELSWHSPENHARNPGEEPGIVRVGVNGNSRYVALKHRQYRPEAQSDPALYDGDVVELTSQIGAEPYVVADSRQVGTEAELNIVDADGNPFDLYANPETANDPYLLAHPELWRNTAEVDGPPETSATKAHHLLAETIAKKASDYERSGGYIDPASARVQDRPTTEDMSPNPYVLNVVGILGGQIGKFIGTGIHEHYDLHVEYSPVVSRYLRTLAPYLNVGLHAAPFGFGETRPELGEILDSDELRKYDGQKISSLRYLTRFVASPNGGAGERVAHDSLADALSHADQRMRDGHVNNPARHLGSHADVRSRYDTPGADLDHLGRLELCVKDTGALRERTLAAYSELSNAVIHLLEQVAAGGEQAIHQLHRDFPKLFGASYKDGTEYGKTQIDITHQNSVAMAYDGSEATVIDGTGAQTGVYAQMQEVVRLADSYKPLSSDVKRTIAHSLVTAEQARGVMQRYKDENGLPTLEGYYLSGVGTASQWMQERATAAQEAGMSGSDIMRDGTMDRVRSFGKYLLYKSS